MSERIGGPKRAAQQTKDQEAVEIYRVSFEVPDAQLDHVIGVLGDVALSSSRSVEVVPVAPASDIRGHNYWNPDLVTIVNPGNGKIPIVQNRKLDALAAHHFGIVISADDQVSVGNVPFQLRNFLKRCTMNGYRWGRPTHDYPYYRYRSTGESDYLLRADWLADFARNGYSLPATITADQRLDRDGALSDVMLAEILCTVTENLRNQDRSNTTPVE